MRTQALAKQEVGDFLTKHFVSVYDKVGTFEVNFESDGRARRNGGNVAAFLCTPNGNVIHVVAGPRTAEAFLAEAKWSVSMFSQITSQSGLGKTPARVAIMLRAAHAEAVQLLNNPDAPTSERALLSHEPPADPKLAGLDQNGRRQRRMVHQLLTNRAFEQMASVGPTVYTAVLGEKVTTRPVQVSGGVEAKQGGRTGQSLAEFFAEGGAAGVIPPPPEDPPVKAQAQSPPKTQTRSMRSRR